MNYIKNLIDALPELECAHSSIENLVELTVNALSSGRTLFIAGNGGSAADAEHISAELLKSFLIKRSCDNQTKLRLEALFGKESMPLVEKLEFGFKAIPLNAFSVFLSAFANDVSWDMSYAQLLYALGNKNDIFLGISCSGNAVNIANALKLAKAKDIKAVLMTGADGGRCKNLADLVISVPSAEVYRIQEYHSKIYHAICAQIEYNIFKNDLK